MSDDRKRQTLPPERLKEVLARLNEVMAEAERLRDEVTRQIELHHREQQQHLTTPVPRKKVSPIRRKTSG